MDIAQKFGLLGNKTKAVSFTETAFYFASFGVITIRFLEFMNNVVWGVPLLVLILGVGIYLSIRTGFVQLRLFPQALRRFLACFRSKNDTSGVSSYQALCTALAATVGTGNIAGVAGAIAIGGPGAVFWMWISAFFGMMTKYAEAVLSVRYRVKQRSGDVVGGPMYMISRGMGKNWTWLAYAYCFCGVVASFGVGNAVQINTVVAGINKVFCFLGGHETIAGNFITGLVLSLLIGLILFGGAKRIGSVAENLVPVASLLYILLCFGVLVIRFEVIDDAFRQIILGAFSPKSVTGGMVGAVFQTIRIGTSRGVFTNEAGLGTAGIAHGAAKVKHPAEQGLMGIMEVFLDTVVICTMTALVILCSGAMIPYGTESGATLTTDAFTMIYGEWICVPITIALSLFAIATILGWGLYGARCAQFLFGHNTWRVFAALQVFVVVLGAVLTSGTVWQLSEIVNGLMAVPNRIALLHLTPQVAELTASYLNCQNNKKEHG